MEKRPKYKHIERRQLMYLDVNVDELIDDNHPARVVWGLTEQLDLRAFESQVRSFEGEGGSSLWPVRLLFSIWLYAYQQGISSARELERRMGWEPGLRWLTGCEMVNHHTLSTFRAQHKQALDEVLCQLLAVLAEGGLVDFSTIVHDGTKIQARASRNSVHRSSTVERKLQAAQAYMDEMDAQPAADEGGRTRQQAARERAARERLQRMQAALEELQRQQQAGKKDPLVSESEPEVRRMKHTEHGGHMYSYNVQLSTESKNNFIVGVALSHDQNDTQLLPGAIHTVQHFTRKTPQRILADNGYLTRESVRKMAALGIEFIAPVKPAVSRDAHIAKQTGISPEYVGSRFLDEENGLRCPAGELLVPVKRIRKHGEWKQVFEASLSVCQACSSKLLCCPSKPARQVYRVIEDDAMLAHLERMKTEAAQQLYAKRSRIAEFPHMRIKGNWRLRRFSMWGQMKATAEALWMVLAYNFSQWAWALRQRESAGATV